MIKQPPLNSPDEITVRTYYKCCNIATPGGSFLQNIEVTDISDLLIGGTVKAIIGDHDIEIDYDKNAIFRYINYYGNYSDNV